MQSVLGDVVEATTINAGIRGSFNASMSLKLTTSNAPIEVNADLTQFYRVPLYKLDLPIYVGECWAFGDADNATAPVQQKPKCNKKKR